MDRPHSGQLLARLERPTTPTPTTLAVLSDVHLATDAAGTWKVFHRTERHLQAAVSGVNDRQIDGVVVAGDLSRDGTPEQFDRFDELAEFDPPMVAVPGNHDLPTAFDDHRSASIASFEERYTPGGLPFRIRFGGLEVIGLNSHAAAPDAPAKTWDGQVSAEQLMWLDETLADSDVDATIVTVHHNLPATGDLYERYRAELPVGGTVPGFSNPEPLVELLASYDVPLVVTGHLHFPAIERTGGVRELTVPAVSSFPHSMLLLEIDARGTVVRSVPLTDGDGMVESIAHGYEKDRVLLSAAQQATFPLVDELESAHDAERDPQPTDRVDHS
ncbi:metallophosphoesterase family protein [Halostagnicola kamekurae]|uniref:Calcineurin-like phosphoesterase n=1 Tax=Halostagnicola kamekurae TaxID=619731 RepID=A0A1I6RNY7_9EURY|nr:metallophosphoesterase [Halostagnicola kamekurae]SFS66402.1 Calcineurin-like phosphoesterase [Halostagnicola kamekurae]